jgi:hypothetical protein
MFTPKIALFNFAKNVKPCQNFAGHFTVKIIASPIGCCIPAVRFADFTTRFLDILGLG